MIDLHIRSVVVLCVISYVICTLFVAKLWRHDRERFDGMGFWAVNFVLQTLALVLIVMRGAIPDWISIFLANALVNAGAVLIYIGLERFVRKPGPQVHNYLLFVVSVAALGVFSLVDPDLHRRTLAASLFLLVICGQCVWLLWRRVEPALRPLTMGAGMVFAGYCLLSVVRIVGYFVGASYENDFFQSGAFEALVMVSYQTLTILLTLSLVLMVNRRLIVDIGIQTSKFASAFDLAPYAITLTRLSDGTIVDMNEQFAAVSGYDRAEVLGKSTIDLQLWERDEDRAAVTDSLARNGRMDAREMHFRKKSGESLVGLFSANIIEAGGDSNVLSCILDITEQKRAEAALRESESLRVHEQAVALEHQRSAGLAALNLMEDAVAARRRTEASAAELRESEARYRLLADNMADVLWTMDLNTRRFTYVSPSVERLRGYTVREVLAQPMEESLTMDSLARVAENIPRRVKAFLAGDPDAVTQTDELEQPCKDGSAVFTEVTSTYLKNDRGDITVVAVTRDISKRKRAELKMLDALAKARRLGAALDQVSAYIYIKDSQSRYIYANQHTLELFGVSAEQLVGCDDNRFFPPETAKQLRQIDARVFAGNRTADEIDVTEADSGRRTYAEVKTPLYADADGKSIWGLIGISTDITERKQADVVLQEYAAELQLTNQELARFNQVAVGRELRMIDLKHEVDALCQRLGEAPRYRFAADLPDDPPNTVPPGLDRRESSP